MRTPEISIVIPIYNEEEIISLLYERTTEAFKGHNYEIICVDDGSKDSSYSLLLDKHQSDERFKLISLSRNFGHQAAVLAGLSVSKGSYIGVMDGDLQDPPELFPKFLEILKTDTDVVYAVRKKRKEGPLKKLAYWLFYRLFDKMSDTKIPVDSGDFCMITRRVLNKMLESTEQSIYLRGTRAWVGYKQVAYEYERDARQAGEAKYDFGQLLKLAYNGIFSFSSLPIRFMRKLGYITLIFGFGYALKVLFSYFAHGSAPEGFVSIILILIFFSGIQMIALGVLGEYIHRIYNESRNKPLFIIGESHL